MILRLIDLTLELSEKKISLLYRSSLQMEIILDEW